MVPARCTGECQRKRPASTPEPQTRTVPSRVRPPPTYVRSKASRLAAGYAHWRPTGDAGTQPRPLKCLLKQDSQIAQGLRTPMGETLRSVRLSQKPVGPTCEMIRDEIASTHHRRTARGASLGFPTGGQRREVSPSTADEGCAGGVAQPSAWQGRLGRLNASQQQDRRRPLASPAQHR